MTVEAKIYDYKNGEVYDARELFDPELPKKIYGILKNEENMLEIISDIESTNRIMYADPSVSSITTTVTLPGYAARIKIMSGIVVIEKIVINGIKLLNKRKIKSFLIDQGIPPSTAEEIADTLFGILEYSEKEKTDIFEEIIKELAEVM